MYNRQKMRLIICTLAKKYELGFYTFLAVPLPSGGNSNSYAHDYYFAAAQVLLHLPLYLPPSLSLSFQVLEQPNFLARFSFSLLKNSVNNASQQSTQKHKSSFVKIIGKKVQLRSLKRDQRCIKPEIFAVYALPYFFSPSLNRNCLKCFRAFSI